MAEPSQAKQPGKDVSRVYAAEAGQPFIRNFDPAEYGGAPQNLAVSQDRQGLIYVGNNNDGVLVFDGTSWRRIAIANRSAVRALAADATGRIYVGAVAELGYLAPNASGEMQYKSLLDRIPKEDRSFSDVWRVFATKDGVFFQTFTHIFRLRGDRVSVWKPTTSFHLAFVAKDALFVREVDRGLMQLVGDRLVQVTGGERFAQEKIYALLPWRGPAAGKSGGLLIGTRTQGWFIFDGSSYRPWITEADDALKRDLLYAALRLADGTLAVATLQGGVRQLDDSGRLLRHLNKANGLVDNTVNSLFEDRQRGLWLGLGMGIARINVDSPITYHDDRAGLEGSIFALSRHAGRLYVGTYHGVFALHTNAEKSAKFVQVTEVPDVSRAFLDMGHSLLVATSGGVYQIAGNTIAQVRASEQAVSLLRSKQNPSRVFVGLRDGIASMQLEKGRWVDEGRIPGVAAYPRTQSEGPDGRLWLGDGTEGVVRITFPRGWAGASGLHPPVRVERFGVDHGLPPGETTVYSIDGRPHFASEAGGLFHFDERRARFAPDPQFAKLFPSGPRAIEPILEDASGRVWMGTADRASGLSEVGAAVQGANGVYRWVPKPLQPIDRGIHAIHGDRDGVMWFGDEKRRVFRYDASVSAGDDPRFAALVRNVLGKNGHLFFGGSGPSLAPDIPYENNALRIEFAGPSYDTFEANRFQVRLDGLDKTWSPWSRETYRDYTNLREGDYRFRVRARNVYGVVGTEGSYAFNILPPWYRTWWAILGFAALLGATLWRVYRWRSGTLRRHNIELAGLVDERTKELSTANQALQEQSITDPLTGLRNRRFVLSTIAEDIAQVRRLYKSPGPTRPSDNTDLLFLMVDLDHFKEVNDRFGHAAGDRVLEQIRDILRSACRESDTPVRWGGEEFLIIGRFINREFAPVFAERIRAMVADHSFDLGDGQTLRRTCSIGFACYPFFPEDVDRLSWEDVVNIADQCLYAAKHSGRNAWVGAHSTDQVPGEDFNAQSTRDLGQLAEEGYLRVLTSVTEVSALHWE